MMVRNVLTISCFWLLCLGMVADTQASIIAANYQGGGEIFDQGEKDLVAGWGFTPTANLRLTGLGVYDLDGGGLNTDHQIGVFRASDGANLAVGSVQDGTGNTLIAGTVGGSRMDSTVFDIALSAGEQYYIVAGYESLLPTEPDDLVWGNSAVTFAPEITWDGFIESYNTHNIFDSVEIFSGEHGNLGATFTFVRGEIPEPSSIAMWSALGIIGLAVARRKRKLTRTAA